MADALTARSISTPISQRACPRPLQQWLTVWQSLPEDIRNFRRCPCLTPVPGPAPFPGPWRQVIPISPQSRFWITTSGFWNWHAALPLKVNTRPCGRRGRWMAISIICPPNCQRISQWPPMPLPNCLFPNRERQQSRFGGPARIRFSSLNPARRKGSRELLRCAPH